MKPISVGSLYSEAHARLSDAHAELLSHVPVGVGEHLVAAKREMLSVLRVVVDEQIKRVDRQWAAAKDKRAAREVQAAESEEAPAAEKKKQA